MLPEAGKPESPLREEEDKSLILEHVLFSD